ncbi:hypothetical protein KSD_47010 [Ktedonobacter sp. SOSP1-85]|uniref:polysaccharide biosynthesis tyrosine autokinase n=1 Tax=Ktedonobacter sp. SOSP1-85 TaxID=2778367 RepID=UPI0019160FE9|nr:polysaccharide biosynthesis tyrosine autokinase [Ktedonobacter sp. SOSP1-85]GHO76930.1 hypothetical protein KSD_47010 [Ktedonobacter sp. SOSP1-85]
MQIYIRHFLWVLKRYLLLIIVGVVLCTVLTGVVSVMKAPKYEAVATVQVSIATGDSTNDVYSNQALAVGYALKMTNSEVLKAASQKSGVSVKDLQDSITAAPLDSTQLIGVHAITEDAQKSAFEANAVANAFIEYEKGSETRRLQGILDKLRLEITTAQSAGDQTAASGLQVTYNNVVTQLSMLDSGLFLEEPALPPTTPNGTGLTTNLVLGFGLSLVLMCVFAILLDWIDVSIKTPEDVARLAQLEPLGSIPLRKGVSTLAPPLVANDEVLDEAFTVVGANFQALYVGQRSLLVTGMRGRDGVTTVASQLAISLVQAGLRVLLIDANLRRPAQHQVFKANNARGLATVLTDVYVLKKQRSQLPAWLSQWKTPMSNLWLLPAGAVSVPPLTVLRSMELRKLVDWLVQDITAPGGSSAVDLIIFDAPSLDAQADVSTLATLCDGCVLVMEAGKTSKDSLKTAQALLQRLSAPLVGVVVNRQKEAHHPYFYAGQQQEEGVVVDTVPVAKYAPRRSAEEVAAAPVPSPSPKPGPVLPSSVPLTPDVPTALLALEEISAPALVAKSASLTPEARKSSSPTSFEQSEEHAPQAEAQANPRVGMARASGWKAPSAKKAEEDDNWGRSQHVISAPEQSYQQNRN